MNTFLRLSITLSLISAATLSYAQNRNVQIQNPLNPAPSSPSSLKRTCGTVLPDAKWDNWFNEQVELYKEKLRTGKTVAASYRIPVIVHVIHGGQAVGTYPNISSAQINSQISILNADFAGTGLNYTNYSATGFTAAVSIANTEISFCAATVDPNGNPLAEPGIDRVNYVSKGWSDPASISSSSSAFQNFINGTVKPNTIWDPNKYLNVWVSDVHVNVGLLGYATFPGSTGLPGLTSGIGTSSTDGVWNWAKAYGNTGSLQSPYNKGRTATHEIGHWLGLRHIGGDGNNNPSGDCNATDYCNDTPSQTGGFSGGQYGQNYGAPTYPRNSGCSTPYGDMFMNFMDYTDDAIMYMFTPDQKTRMQTAMQSGQFRSNIPNNVTSICGGSGSSSCSTITAVSSSHSLTAFIAAADAGTNGCSPKAGYIYGTNCYGDKEKAEFFPGSMYGNTAGQLTNVTVLFFQTNTRGTYGNASTPVNIKVYQGVGSSAPGTLLGSATVSMGVLNTAPIYSTNPYCGNPGITYSESVLLPYTYTFSPALSVPAAGFFVSVEIPGSSGDTVVVMNNSSVSANPTWEKWSNNSWSQMSTSWGSSLGNKGMGILPVVCTGVIGLNETMPATNMFIVKPNPSAGLFNLQLVTTVSQTKPVTAKVVNTMGQVVYEHQIHASGTDETAVDLRHLANGIYILVVENGNYQATQKIIIAH